MGDAMAVGTGQSTLQSLTTESLEQRSEMVLNIFMLKKSLKGVCISLLAPAPEVLLMITWTCCSDGLPSSGGQVILGARAASGKW